MKFCSGGFLQHQVPLGSNMDCNKGVVNVYNSLFKVLDEETMDIITNEETMDIIKNYFGTEKVHGKVPHDRCANTKGSKYCGVHVCHCLPYLLHIIKILVK